MWSNLTIFKGGEELEAKQGWLAPQEVQERVDAVMEEQEKPTKI